MNLEDMVRRMGANDLRIALLGEQEMDKVMMSEGGNRFDFVTKIHQRNAKATMDDVRQKVKEFFKLKDDEIIFTGSTGKKLDSGSSGDIDCAISKVALNKNFGIERPEEWFDICEEFAKKNNIELSKLERFGWEGISFAWPIVNNDGEQEGEFVQLDLNPDDSLKFRGWAQYAPAEEEGVEYVKGLVRNQIISAAARVSGFKVIQTGKVNKKDGENNPTKWERYSYSSRIGGLYKKSFERELMKGKNGEQGIHKGSETSTGMELVSNDPDEICEILFGVDSENMLTWQDAWNACKKIGIFKDPKKKEIFKKSLTQGLEEAVKKGSCPYLPPEIVKFTGIDINNDFGVYKKRKDEEKKEEDLKKLNEGFGGKKDKSDIDTPRMSMTKIHQLTGTPLRKFLTDFI